MIALIVWVAFLFMASVVVCLLIDLDGNHAESRDVKSRIERKIFDSRDGF